MVAISTTSEAYTLVLALVEMSYSIVALNTRVFEVPTTPLTSFKIACVITSTYSAYFIKTLASEIISITLTIRANVISFAPSTTVSFIKY